MNSTEESRDWKRFLAFLISSAPRLKPPPFFAQRVANLAQVEKYSFAGSLQAFARRLVPVFMTVSVLICLVLYRSTTLDPLVESAIFYDEEYLADTITVEYVVNSLAVPSDDENENY